MHHLPLAIVDSRGCQAQFFLERVDALLQARERRDRVRRRRSRRLRQRIPTVRDHSSFFERHQPPAAPRPRPTAARARAARLADRPAAPRTADPRRRRRTRALPRHTRHTSSGAPRTRGAPPRSARRAHSRRTAREVRRGSSPCSAPRRQSADRHPHVLELPGIRSTSRSFSSPARIRVFTVPSGCDSCSAISLCDRPL